VISTPGIMAVLSGLLFSFGFLLIASGIRNSVAAIRYVGAALVSIPIGGLTYAIIGSKLGQHLGHRFYSIPFGAAGLQSRTAIWGSVACWVLFWCLVLSLVMSRLSFDRQADGAENGR